MSADDPDKEHKLEGALPCPFCGGDDIWTYAGSTFRWRYAACSECGAQSGEVRIDTIGKARHAAVAEADKECLVEWNHRPPTEAEQAFHRPTWIAALTLAHNLCAQYSNRHNDNDETEQADALNEMCGHIKPYLDCTDEEIAEMVAEANPSSYVQQSIQQEKP